MADESGHFPGAIPSLMNVKNMPALINFGPVISPPKLKKGDKVGIVATARKLPSRDAIALCIKTLKDWNLDPVFGRNLFKEDNQFAGTDAERLDDLQSMIDNPDIKCILAARGGYGTLRIIDEIKLDGIAMDPKWVIGFSDMTPLLIRIRNEGIEAIHGPMGISFDGSTGDDASVGYLRQILMGEGVISYQYAPENQDLIRTGSAEGELIGGNLSLLNHCIGTRTDFGTTNGIFFFEDVEEYLYSIDRLVIHMKRSGKFESIKGLIVGGMTDLKDNDIPFGKTTEEIVAEHVKKYDFPVCFGFPTGHWPRNYPLIIGRKATLKVTHVNVEFSFQS